MKRGRSRGWQHHDGASLFQIETMSRNHIYEPKENWVEQRRRSLFAGADHTRAPTLCWEGLGRFLLFRFFRFVFRFFRRPLPELHCGQGQARHIMRTNPTHPESGRFNARDCFPYG